MAEDESSEERTEEASARRLEEARKHGQVARSRDLAMAMALIAGSVSLLVFANSIGVQILRLATINLSVPRSELLDSHVMVLHMQQGIWVGLHMLFAPLAIMMLATIAGSVLLGGFMFSTESLFPKWDRLDPMTGLGRMFTSRSVLELFKALIKLVLVGFCCLLILRSHRDEILGLDREAFPQVFGHVVHLLLWSLFWMTASMILVAMMDAPAQWFSFMKELRMTRQELKDEFKEAEGRPEVKGRIRQMQRKMAEARMMQKIPEADLVITNPTHFAVALRYRPEQDKAPVLLAKGVDHMALQIRKVAGEHRVTTIESPALARSIYHSTDLDREIPAGLYQAVARILAWLHAVRLYQAGKSRHPGQVPRVDIPVDLQRD